MFFIAVFCEDENIAVINIGVFLCAGDALSNAKALRDASRFVGKEDTVPLRLLYSMHNHSQVMHDVLNTRLKASSGSIQVHDGFVVVFIMMAAPRNVQMGVRKIPPVPVAIGDVPLF